MTGHLPDPSPALAEMTVIQIPVPFENRQGRMTPSYEKHAWERKRK